MKLSTPLATAALLAVFGLPAAPTRAATVNWVGPDGGHFGEAANWDGGVLPDDVSDALIATAQDREVIGPADALQLKSLTVGGGVGIDLLMLVQEGQLSTLESTQLLANGRLNVISGSDATFGIGRLGGHLVTHSGSALLFRANRPQEYHYDRLVIDGELIIEGGDFVLSFDGGSPAPQLGDSYDFIDWRTPVRGGAMLTAGRFDHLVLPELAPGLGWDTSRFYVDGSLSVTAVPEPAGYALLAGGLLAMGWRLRRRG